MRMGLTGHGAEESRSLSAFHFPIRGVPLSFLYAIRSPGELKYPISRLVIIRPGGEAGQKKYVQKNEREEVMPFQRLGRYGTLQTFSGGTYLLFQIPVAYSQMRKFVLHRTTMPSLLWRRSRRKILCRDNEYSLLQPCGYCSTICKLFRDEMGHIGVI